MYPLQESRNFALDVNDFVSFVRTRGSRVAVICNPKQPRRGLPAQARGPAPARPAHRPRSGDRGRVVRRLRRRRAVPGIAAEAAVRPNVIVLRSLGKNFGLHGIRFGYLVANPALAGRVRDALPKWNLNSFAEVVVS
ncbi:aminotransferase class I/II-fold pyridoxal phosphate-dependent enzyme [Nonomuraea rubra]|uniref:aminotransferase class I/II-fold pyridoxal phosphate-dependent enzyme n=1 Tax=Nonomuraea rubra TaxID=46180 RepID=UPI0031EEC0E5